MHFKTSATGQTLTDKMENGEICCLCQCEIEEEYGRPGACEDCGGDFVLFKEPPDPPGFEGGFAEITDMSFDDIPEDKEPSYPCDCGGSIKQNIISKVWECEECGWIEGMPKD